MLAQRMAAGEGADYGADMEQFPVDMRSRTGDSLTRLGEPLGTTVQIADGSGKEHTVLTNTGEIDLAELARLKEEMLHGNVRASRSGTRCCTAPPRRSFQTCAPIKVAPASRPMPAASLACL